MDSARFVGERVVSEIDGSGVAEFNRYVFLQPLGRPRRDKSYTNTIWNIGPPVIFPERNTGHSRFILCVIPFLIAEIMLV